MFHCSTKYYLLWVNLLWIALCCTVDALWVLLLWIVRVFTVDCNFWQGCGWAGGSGVSLEASPRGCCPLALSLPSLGAGGRPGRQAHRHVALGQHHPKPAAQRHLVLGLLTLECNPSTTWCLGCLYF